MSTDRPTAADLRRRFAAGEQSARDALRGCLERIGRLDGSLGAFLRLNPAAEAEAAEADGRIERGERGAWLGIPIAIKDNINTRGLTTTCGSRALADFVPLCDATAVERLRHAGAVIVGKTNLDEFGMGSSTENSAWRPTRNPWDPSRVPGGSSGGSAAAVAAGLVPVALGTDTGGSVRQPAAFCGVVGLKPSQGRVSRSGLVAFGSSLEQVGSIAGCVADAAGLLEAMAGPDGRDATCARRPGGRYVEACARGGEGLRVGLPREFFAEGLEDPVRRAVLGAAEALAAAGASVEEVSLPHTAFTIPAYYVIAMAEASSNLARYDGIRYGTSASGDADLAALYRRNRAAGFGPEVRRRILLGTWSLSAGYHDAFYGKAQQVRALVRRDFVEVFAAGVDVLLTPTTPSVAFRIGERIEDPLAMYLSDLYTASVNLAGLPAMSVPLGTNGAGLPVGGQLIGPDFGEESVCRAGAVIEQRFPPIAPPWAAMAGGEAPERSPTP